MLAALLFPTQTDSTTPDSIPDNVLPPTVEFIVEDWRPDEVTSGGILAAVIILLASILIAFFISRVTRWAITRWSRMPLFAAALIGRLVSYLIVLLGLVMALESVGLTIGPMVIIVAAIVMVAWALRPLFQDMGAGLMLQARGPFQPGDQIQSLGYEGDVQQLDARVVEIRTPDGKTVFIPNTQVASSPIVNYTDLGARRSTFDVGVDYATDLDQAVEVIRDALAGTPGVLEDPPPEAFVYEFDDSNVTISAWLWHAPEIYEAWKVRDEAARATFRELRAAGIVISFPRRKLEWADPAPGDSPETA